MIRMFLSILILFRLTDLFSQTEYYPKQGKLIPNSIIEIKGESVIDTKTNTELFPTAGRFGETKWYKTNDSTFQIDFYTTLPDTDSVYWKEHLVVKLILVISKDSFNLTRDKSYIGYPILTNSTIKFIKEQVKHPDKRYEFEKFSDWNRKDSAFDLIDSYFRTVGLTAVAIMNGHSELLSDFNNLQNITSCQGGVCFEIYYDMRLILSLFDYRIYKGQDGKKYLEKR
jgi:hypothetical protein